MLRVDLSWLGRSPRDVAENIREINDVLATEFRRDLIDSGFHNDVAEMMRQRIRTKQQDIFEQPLAPLSPGYRRQKTQEAGLSGRPDLTLTGQSVDAIQGETDPFGVGVADTVRDDTVVGDMFVPGGQTAEYLLIVHQEGRGNNPERAGFGLTPGERTLATAAAIEIFREVTMPRVRRIWES